jgi:hypothetical protein
MRAIAAICLFFMLLSPVVMAAEFSSNWQKQNDRIWLGPEYWANPMEDWKVANGRIECTHRGPNRSVHLLTRQLSDDAGGFTMSVRLGRSDAGKQGGAAGFLIGVKSELQDYRSALLFGNGLSAGVSTDGRLFIGKQRNDDPAIPKLTKAGVDLRLVAVAKGNGYSVTLAAHDVNGRKKLGELSRQMTAEQLKGNIALLHNGGSTRKGGKGAAGALFWFSDLKMAGDKVMAVEDRAFGPVLYAMHSLSRGVMKMTAQMPPVGEKDAKQVRLELRVKGEWKKAASATIHPAARTAAFRIENWDSSVDTPYRLRYRHGERDHIYTGTVRAEPKGRPVSIAGFTGNTDTGFPNSLIARNVAIQNPDVLFFSGDQIYESVGGFGIYRTPVDRSIVNYLRKIYLWGWAFRDLMRDRPTLALPDDHDVYQGNIWGNGGNATDMKNHSAGGYAMHEDFVNVVHMTQTSHHPDAFDPSPIKRGISVYHGDMVYGRVSFAIIADRMFKAGPQGTVAKWKGRPDHVKDTSIDPAVLDRPELPLLGERQEAFLEHWAGDWKGADMKIVLSQTIFVNLANYHGRNQDFLHADLDSNGWPQSGRNRALAAMRKGFALHYAGDQHLASITHYGIDEHADSGFAFCVPSIAAGYPRSWRPDHEGRAVKNRRNGPNTGDYFDGLGNRITVWAVGNPAATNRAGRINTLHDKASGHGIVRMDPKTRSMTMECWRLQFDAKHPRKVDQFPGWPLTIQMEQCYSRKAVGFLPTINVSGCENPLFRVINEENGELVYAIRPGTTSYRPKIFAEGTYTVEAGDPDDGRMQVLKGVKPAATGSVQVKLP